MVFLARSAVQLKFNENRGSQLSFSHSTQSMVSCQVVGFAMMENALLVRMKSEKATGFISKLKVSNLLCNSNSPSV